ENVLAQRQQCDARLLGRGVAVELHQEPQARAHFAEFARHSLHLSVQAGAPSHAGSSIAAISNTSSLGVSRTNGRSTVSALSRASARVRREQRLTPTASSITVTDRPRSTAARAVARQVWLSVKPIRWTSSPMASRSSAAKSGLANA